LARCALPCEKGEKADRARVRALPGVRGIPPLHACVRRLCSAKVKQSSADALSHGWGRGEVWVRRSAASAGRGAEISEREIREKGEGMGSTLVRKFKNVGPGALVAAGFIGPGTVTTCTVSGASYGYTMLWALLFATVAPIIFQEMASRV